MSRIEVAAFQFCGSDSLEHNADAIRRGIASAHAAGARILLTQEAALPGYAGVDRESPASIDQAELARQTEGLGRDAAAADLALALGTTVFEGEIAYNALQFFVPGSAAPAVYCKRAPYGEDAIHYGRGRPGGVVFLDTLRVGLRICFEFRFPEYFRELLLEQADLALIAFSMVGPDDAKRATACAHLVSRAAENAMPVVTANNLNGVQNAPTCILDADGVTLAEAPPDAEALIHASVVCEPGPPLREHIRRWARDLAGEEAGGAA